MVTHTRNWCSAFNPSKCTHTAVSSEHTAGAVGSHCSSARGAIGGSVPCTRAPQSWYWRWRECCSFTIPTFNPCRTWDSNPQPLDCKSDSLTIRPRLPLIIKRKIRQRRPRTLQQLATYIRQEWDQIPTPKLQKLIPSMTRCLQTILKKREDATPW